MLEQGLAFDVLGPYHTLLSFFYSFGSSASFARKFFKKKSVLHLQLSRFIIPDLYCRVGRGCAVATALL